MDRHFPTREVKRLSPQAHLMAPQATWRAGVTASKSGTPPQPRPTEPPLPLYCGGDDISVGLPIHKVSVAHTVSSVSFSPLNLPHNSCGQPFGPEEGR